MRWRHDSTFTTLLQRFINVLLCSKFSHTHYMVPCNILYFLKGKKMVNFIYLNEFKNSSFVFDCLWLCFFVFSLLAMSKISLKFTKSWRCHIIICIWYCQNVIKTRVKSILKCALFHFWIKFSSSFWNNALMMQKL